MADEVELEGLFGSEDGAEEPEQQIAGDAADDAAEDDAGAAAEAELFDEDMQDAEPAPAAAEDLFGSDEPEPAPRSANVEERGPPIEVEAPLLPRPEPGRVLLMKRPNILRIEPRPWDPDTFEGGFEEVKDERGVRRMRPADINVIRWRYRAGEDGVPRRETNARYVTWSNGSESIVLGDEVLSVDRKQQARAHTYLYVVRYQAIQGQAHLNERLTVAPASLDSKLHKRLKMMVQAASQKTDKVQLHYAARNPEAEKAEAEKRAEDDARLHARQERAMSRGLPRARAQQQRYYSAAAAQRGAGYLEEEEEEEGDEDFVAAAAAYDSDDDAGQLHRTGGDDDEEAAARLQSAKRASPPPAAAAAAGARREAGRGSRKRGRSSDDAETEDEPGGEEAAVAAAAEEPEPAEAAEAAAPGLKVRRGAILDDDDD